MYDDAILAIAAFSAGVLNTIAGGGTFLTFPALVFVGDFGSDLCDGGIRGVAACNPDDGGSHGRWLCRRTAGPRAAKADGTWPDRGHRFRDERNFLIASFLTGGGFEALGIRKRFRRNRRHQGRGDEFQNPLQSDDAVDQRNQDAGVDVA